MKNHYIKKYQKYGKYVSHLDALMKRTQFDLSSPDDERDINSALDGEAYSKLVELIPVDILRTNGAFFTGSYLGKLAISDSLHDINHKHIFLDPACGTGDLLTKCANFLPIETSLEATLEQWGKQLIGRDINPYFIKAARKRIALLAIKKGSRSTSNKKLPLAKLLPQIKIGDALKERGIYLKATHIVTNPPYYMALAYENCAWGKGKINMASVFIEKCLKAAKPNTMIIAILPDVLRTGTRYCNWRKSITELLYVKNIESFGLFDDIADVDVFIMTGVNKSKSASKFKIINWGYQSTKSKKVSDEFNIHVGPVVPHRHPNLGQWYPYLHARNLLPWETMSKISEHRRSKGKTFKPPFVVIRRTSRPDEKFRAVGTLIDNDSSVSVENHLIVCLPKDGTLQKCKKLIKILKDERTNDWLNKRIRCRHLTTASIEEIPWV